MKQVLKPINFSYNKHFSLSWRTTETSSYKRGHKHAYGQTSFLVQQGSKSYRLRGGKRKTKSKVDLIAKKVVDAARNLHGIQEIKPKDPFTLTVNSLFPAATLQIPPTPSATQTKAGPAHAWTF